jgi:hypothetical protein
LRNACLGTMMVFVVGGSLAWEFVEDCIGTGMRAEQPAAQRLRLGRPTWSRFRGKTMGKIKRSAKMDVGKREIQSSKRPLLLTHEPGRAS